ncbi:hypothetical protein VNI00_013386 [Paramarasmius palmivorus]|uniref:Uncharacterized protein n=1 Tax=Paramarasmius palmivorus TaxID=297713 RepID=A0AAW0BZ93_9AGAR
MATLQFKLCSARNFHTAARNMRYLKYRLSLRRYFPATLLESFRIMQAHTDTIIIGQSAVEAILGSSENNVLELSVSMAHARGVSSFILAADGEYLPRNIRPGTSLERSLLEDLSRRHSEDIQPCPPVTDSSFIFNVLRFKTPLETFIEVTIVDEHPLQSVFHMRYSHHMAFVSSSHTVMLYPRSTLLDRVTLDFTTPCFQGSKMRVSCFANASFTVNPALTAADALDHTKDSSVYLRYVGDRKSWCEALPPLRAGEGDSMVANDTLPTNHSWQAMYSASTPPVLAFRLFYFEDLMESYFLAPPVYDFVNTVIQAPLNHPSFALREQPLRLTQMFASVVERAFAIFDDDEARFSILLIQLLQGLVHAKRRFPFAVQPSAAIASSLHNIFLNLPSLWGGTAKVNFLLLCRGLAYRHFWTQATVTFSVSQSSRAVGKPVVHTHLAINMANGDILSGLNYIKVSDIADGKKAGLFFDIDPSSPCWKLLRHDRPDVL